MLTHQAHKQPGPFTGWLALGVVVALLLGVLLLTPGGFTASAGPLQDATATPTVTPYPTPKQAPRDACQALRVHGWDNEGAGEPVNDPITGRLAEDPPYTAVSAPFDPQHPQAPIKDVVTWNPAWMSEAYTPDENGAKGLYARLFIDGINASEKVWFRMWYEPLHWDKDLNANDISDEDDERYPAIMQEFTYLLMENRPPTQDPLPAWGRVGWTSMVFPIGMKEEVITDTYGYGLTSLDANFDGTPDIVHLESELTLLDVTSIAADFNGNGQLDPLDQDTTVLNGNELAVLRLDALRVPLNGRVQFLDHMAELEGVFDDAVTVRVWYTGDPVMRDLGTINLSVQDMVLAGTQGPLSPGKIRAIRNGGPGTNMCNFPPGPWFVQLVSVDTIEGTARLLVGRGLGATWSAMEDGANQLDRRPGDPWFLKRFYVDGHEHNVVAIHTRNGGGPAYPNDCDLDDDNDGVIDNPAPSDFSQFQYITLRTPIPKVPVTIEQHSVRLQDYPPGVPLSVLPPFNYEHYILRDVITTTGSGIGTLTGPVPPILQSVDPFPYIVDIPNEGVRTYDNPDEVYYFYTQEAANPEFIGELKEKYGEGLPPLEGPQAEFWYVEQWWTLPWEYTEFCLPDISSTQDLYLMTSAFYAPQGSLSGSPFVDPGLGPRVNFWFDPAQGGKKYKNEEGIRLYGSNPFDAVGGTAGDLTVTSDTRVATPSQVAAYPVEIPPYTDPWAPFNPQLPQAPRKDSLTFNPAYMDEFSNGNEPISALYGQISIEGDNAREKVYPRMWYEPNYLDKILQATVDGGITITESYTFPALMQEYTYMFLDMLDQPSHGQPGSSRLAFPMATGATELPKPVTDTLPSAYLPSFGYGITTFDANFDSSPDIVTIHSERTLSSTTGIQADFDGDGQMDQLDTDGTPLSGDELVVFTVEILELGKGDSIQFLDHMITLENIAWGGVAEVQFWHTGGGLHPVGPFYSLHPDRIGTAIPLQVGDMAIANKTTVRRIPAGGNNLGRVDGAWFAYVAAVDTFSEKVAMLVGRALGATHSAIDDGMGGHDLAPGDPWYLKRFFVDGHEYNVVAIMTVPSDSVGAGFEDYEFKYITIRTPVPKEDDFVNYEDSLVLQGYFQYDRYVHGVDTNIASVMPPFNTAHTRRDDIQPLYEWEFADPGYYDPDCIGPIVPVSVPLTIEIVDEGREPQFSGSLLEVLNETGDGWDTQSFQVYPDEYTDLRLPPGQLYLLTSDWRSIESRLHFFGCDPVTDTQDELAAAHPGIPGTNAPPPDNDRYFQADRDNPVRVKFWYDPSRADAVYTRPWVLGVSAGPTPTPTNTPTVTPTPTPTATPSTLVRIEPISQMVGVGVTTTADIRIENVTNLYGAQVNLTFDPSILQVVDSNPGQPGVQIQEGTFPDPSSGAGSVVQSVDNVAGTITYAVTLISPAPPVSGSGVLATIVFTGTSTGTSNIHFTSAQLVDNLVQPIPSTTQDGSIEVVLTLSSLQGRAYLQGRSDHSGVSIRAGSYAGTTGPDAQYALTLPPSTYEVMASKPGYLPSYLSGVNVEPGSPTVLDDVSLVGGDVNQDGIINIFDLVLVGLNFGQAPPSDARADVNGDGGVDIFDLVLIGVNYGIAGPTAWVNNYIGGARALAAQPVSVQVRGPDRALSVGEEATIEVTLEGVRDLYAAELHLRLDPTRVEVVDADAGTAGAQLEPGELLSGQDGYVVQNRWDADAGRLDYAVTLLAPSPPVSGGGVLARFTIHALAEGVIPVKVADVRLADANGAPVFASAHSTTVTVGQPKRIYLPWVAQGVRR